MSIKRVVQTWFSGWRDLVCYVSIPGYESRGWMERKRMDHAALWSLCYSSRFRCAALLLVAAHLLVLSLAWHLDLGGWQRDLLRAAPALFVMPWFANARKVTIESGLRATGPSIREGAHRHRRQSRG